MAGVGYHNNEKASVTGLKFADCIAEMEAVAAHYGTGSRCILGEDWGHTASEFET